MFIHFFIGCKFKFIREREYCALIVMFISTIIRLFAAKCENKCCNWLLAGFRFEILVFGGFWVGIFFGLEDFTVF